MSTTGAPERRYRIAEAARLTGFTPSALRFYERAGVVAPPARTAAGYREYDDRDVERLRLIARTKDLGCTLEEVAGVVEAWDAGECAPVKLRLRSLADDKVAAIDQHVADQMAAAARLQAASAHLGRHPVVEGPCDDRCGCSPSVPDPTGPTMSTEPRCGGSSTDGPTQVVPLVRPRHEDGPTVACTLSSGEVDARVAAWQSILTAVEHRQSIPGGLRLELAAGASVGEIARLALAEHECCRFFSLALTMDDRGIALEVTAPADGRPVLDALFGGG